MKEIDFHLAQGLLFWEWLLLSALSVAYVAMLVRNNLFNDLGDPLGVVLDHVLPTLSLMAGVAAAAWTKESTAKVPLMLVATAVLLSLFFFISLAFIKRYSELLLVQNMNGTSNKGRGYSLVDLDLLRSVGPTSGYLSMLVLALYINSTQVATLYKDPTMLWLIGPFLFYWITRIWFRAHRGKMHDDPIVFTVKDPRSYIIGGIVGIIIFLASRFSFFKDLIQS